MEETTLRVPYLEEGLISHLRGRLGALGASIVISDIWHPALQRDRDIAIMEVLLRLPGVKPTDLIKANMCRKWLRVITIAELASICSTKIPAKHFTGRWRAKSNLNWPNQPSPTSEMWTVFRRLIKRAFCSRANTFQFDWMSLWTHLWEHGSLPRDTSNTSTIVQAKPSFIDSLIIVIRDTLKATFHHSTFRARCGTASHQKLSPD